MPPQSADALKNVLSEITLFCKAAGGIPLRSYQRQVAQTIVRSVIARQGRSFVVMFPRQSGKNELQAQIETYLLMLFSQEGGELVKVSPTWKPQSINAMRRLERTLRRNIITKDLWEKESGYIYRIGKASISFLSGAKESNIVGATATLVLQIDEAQDVSIAKYDHEIAPMAASQNATRVFWGTAWTEDTLLARELRAAAIAEKDGCRRVFRINAEAVAREVPAYGKFVDEQVQKFGRQHPLIRSQYFSEELNGQVNLFHEERLRRMQGTHACQQEPAGGETVILLIDVAGSDETSNRIAQEDARDATAVTLCRVMPPATENEGSGVIWQAVNRQLWTNLPLTEQFERISRLIERWNPLKIVIDATGIGSGLASFFLRAFGSERVIPFTFTAASKSRLGWDFLSIIDSGRWQEAAASADPLCAEQEALKALFFRQLRHCQSELLPGPEKKMRWGVPDGARDPESGVWLHDDLILSAALTAVVDGTLWQPSSKTLIIRGADPLLELDKGY